MPRNGQMIDISGQSGASSPQYPLTATMLPYPSPTSVPPPRCFSASLAVPENEIKPSLIYAAPGGLRVLTRPRAVSPCPCERA